MTTTIGNADGKAPDGPIKSSDMSSFMADVVEESGVQPVLVDFWADWCEPCKALTPLLEKVVNQAGGTVKLVKVNVDENKDLAAQLRVQSLPTVMAFKDGQPVDGFAGVLPESEIKAFIVKVGGNFGAPDIGGHGATRPGALLWLGKKSMATGAPPPPGFHICWPGITRI